MNPMAPLSQQLQRFLLTGLTQDSSFKSSSRTSIAINSKSISQCCSAIAIDAPSSLTGVSGIPWGVDRQVVSGRIRGNISVPRAFGEIRYETKKNKLLQKGVKWLAKFVSRIQFNDDLVTASPEVYKVTLSSDAEFVALASDG